MELSNVTTNKSGDPTVTITLTGYHKTPHHMDPASDPADPDAWQALCGRHQVVKKNYWDSSTGKMNYVAIVQAAPAAAKTEILRILLDYFGYNLEEIDDSKS